MASAALQPNLENVSMAFILCSALHIRMALPALFWSRIPTVVPYGANYIAANTGTGRVCRGCSNGMSVDTPGSSLVVSISGRKAAVLLLRANKRVRGLAKTAFFPSVDILIE